MKGTLHKTESGWQVRYPKYDLTNTSVQGTKFDEDYFETLPLIDNGHIDGLKLYDSNEGLVVDFEIVTNYDNNGPDHFPKFARILTPEEAELKDWDVTLMDGSVICFNTGMALMSVVLRVYFSKVRIPRSHKITCGLPDERMYSALISSSSMVDISPRLSSTGSLTAPTARSSS